jgi:hypothetical protein
MQIGDLCFPTANDILSLPLPRAWGNNRDAKNAINEIAGANLKLQIPDRTEFSKLQ